jgi:hypothetical protein
LVGENEASAVEQEPRLDIEYIKQHLDMLDQRLDNIDSVVSAVVERVMSQPLALNITCPKCGKNIEITIIGSQKPRK